MRSICSSGGKYLDFKGITADNLRNTAIVMINKRTNIPVSQLAGEGAQQLLGRDYFDAHAINRGGVS